MTINSFQKLLSIDSADIFLVRGKDGEQVTARQVMLCEVPIYEEVYDGKCLDDAVMECHRLGRSGVQCIIIVNDAVSKDDLDMLACRYTLYREMKSEGAFSIMQRYYAEQGEWHECCSFEFGYERMLHLRQLEADPDTLVLKGWEPQILSEEECYRAVVRCMYQDFKEGLIPKYLDPYFEWKLGSCDAPTFSLQEAEAMYEDADNALELLCDKHPGAISKTDSEHCDNPWRHTEAFGEDKRIAAYLEIITDELAELRASRILTTE